MKNTTYITINKKNINSNFLKLKNIKKKSKLWSVIKSNAYGHKIKNIVNILKNSDGFAVLNINEGIEVRNNKWNGPILILEGFFSKNDFYNIIKYNFTPVIYNNNQINIIKNSNYNYKKKINIYLKLNSGMNRLGFKYNEFIKNWNLLKKINLIKNITIMTHFLNYENSIIKKQMKIVNYVIKKINYNKLCLSNSSNLILNKIKIHESWVRSGILLYGLSPHNNYKLNKIIEKKKIKQVIGLYSKIISIHKIEKRSYVGYNKNFISNKKMKIGTILLGYGDGYPYSICNYKNKYIPLYIKNCKSKIIGEISMNMISIDLTNIKKIKIGDTVELFGNNIKINHLSKLLNIPSYVIVSNISDKIPTKIINI